MGPEQCLLMLTSVWMEMWHDRPSQVGDGFLLLSSFPTGDHDDSAPLVVMVELKESIFFIL